MFLGIIVWTTIILVTYFSIKKPESILVFAVVFGCYWIGKSVVIAVGIVLAFIKMKTVESIDWEKKTKLFYLKPTRQEKINLSEIPQKDRINFEDIYHVVIHANYQEPPEIVIPAVRSLFEANYDKKKIISVLANEMRNQEVTEENRDLFHKEFDEKFFGTISTLHPDLPEEVKAKGANLKFAIQEAMKFIKKNKIPIENVIVSAFDGDTQIHPEYFKRLTYLFITTPERYKKSYQPVPTYLNNVWDAPWFSRVTAFGTSFYFMEECMLSNEYLFTYSGHATSLKLLIETGFWSVDCINEDSKQFWKAFVHYKGETEAVPIDLPIYMDAVLAENTTETLKNQYKQLQRWAYGAEHIPYILINVIKIPELRKYKNLKKAIRYIYANYTWAAAPFLVTCSTTLPFLFHPNLVDTLFGSTFIFLNGLIWSFGYISILTYFFMSLVASGTFFKKSEAPRKKRNIIFMAILQWIFYPLTILWLHGIAGIDSATRLLFGKYLTYWTTQKVRK